MIRQLIKIGVNDSLIKNSFYLIISSFFNAFLGMIFWIIAAKYYSPGNIGIISAIFSSTALISSISSIGLPTALVYYLPRDSGNISRIIDSSIITSIISSAIFSLIFILGLKIWSPELKDNFDIGLSIIFIFITISTAISVLVSGVFIARKRSSYAMFKDNLYNIMRMVSLGIFAGFGIIGTFISLSIGLIFSIIMSFILLYKTWKYLPTFKFDPIIKKMSRYSFGNYIAGILNNLPRLVLPLIIINIISSEKTGYFYIAFTAAGLLYGISQSISSSLLAESNDKIKFEDNINKAISFNILLLIPGLVFFIIFGKMLLGIFNHSYAENATNTLIILSISSIPLSLINIFNSVRNAQNKVNSIIKMNGIVAGLTIFLSIILIRFNIEGIALAFLISNVIGAIIVINRIKNPVKYTLKLISHYREIANISNLIR